MDKKENIFEGPITMTRKGIGFFTYDSEKDDFIIPPEDTRHAFQGDIVKVVPTGTYRDPAGRMPPRASGRVVEIVSRARETFVGALVEEEGRVILIPDYKKMHVPIVIKGGVSAPTGYKVLARITDWKEDAPYPYGEIEEVIGEAGLHETEMRALVLGQGFNPSFPPGVEEDAKYLEANGKQLLEGEIQKGTRRDFRGIPTLTIDPYDAKDFDDALSIQKLPNGNVEVGIHIADVSFFVKPGSNLDKEARERATSIYLVDRTIPMLPEILSNNLCSLRPNEDRLAMSTVFELGQNAEIVARWFGETVIHSDKRFTYEEAQEVLEKGAGTMSEELKTFHSLAEKIREKRQARGAIEFDTPEVKVELDDAGKPIRIYLKERRETNLLIEDFMLLANEAVAEHIAKLSTSDGHKHNYLYRVHDSPDADRIENLAQFLRVLGYDLKTQGGQVKGADINTLLEKVEGKPEEYLIKMATLRSMAKAVYATKNVGHYGLAFTHYTHFTSPIRRYPDLLVHRIIKHHTGGEPIDHKEFNEFEEIAVHSSEREVAATDAERASIKLKQVEFMANKIGEEFDAVISGVSERGLYVEEKETRSEGMVRISAIGDDYFDYDEKHYRLVGRRTKESFQLGDPIRVRLVVARISEKELDFELVN